MAAPGKRLHWVQWEDSSRTNGSVWKTPEEAASGENEVCTSVGFMVHEDRSCVVMAGHSGSSYYSGDIRIPKRSILRRKVLGRVPA